MNGNPKLTRVGRGIERPTWLPEPRPSHLVLDEVGGTAGYVLWLLLNDCDLWIAAEQRSQLFASGGRDWADTEWPAELVDAFSILRAASAAPELARAADLASAAATVWEWAERQGHMEAALQFAELAARLEPDSSGRAGTAGRLCRRRGGLYPRATRWFQRATRLARMHGDEIAFSTAELGWGILELMNGNLLHAEAHLVKAYRRAMRAGRHSLAGPAKHNLIAVTATAGRHDEAWSHAREAVKLYAAYHPAFPRLAYDVALMLVLQGYHSSAIPVIERALQFFDEGAERMAILATQAGAAGVARDRVRFERSAAEVLRLVEHATEMADSAFLHLAQGARCFEQWDRAETWARRSVHLAGISGDKPVQRMAVELLEAVVRRDLAPEDSIPPADGEVDQMVALLLKRLKKHTAPPDRRAVPPERFPVY